jgi:hypothetical protein
VHAAGEAHAGVVHTNRDGRTGHGIVCRCVRAVSRPPCGTVREMLVLRHCEVLKKRSSTGAMRRLHVRLHRDHIEAKHWTPTTATKSSTGTTFAEACSPNSWKQTVGSLVMCIVGWPACRRLSLAPARLNRLMLLQRELLFLVTRFRVRSWPIVAWGLWMASLPAPESCSCAFESLNVAAARAAVLGNAIPRS